MEEITEAAWAAAPSAEFTQVPSDPCLNNDQEMTMRNLVGRLIQVSRKFANYCKDE